MKRIPPRKRNRVRNVEHVGRSPHVAMVALLRLNGKYSRSQAEKIAKELLKKTEGEK